jgi:uncharacterized protein YraI
MPLSLKLLAGAMAGAVLLVSAGAAQADPGQATASVNVRSGPGTQYAIRDQLYPGEDVDIGRCTAGWCYIQHDGLDGWVSANYLEFFDDRYAPPPVVIERPPRVYVEPPPVYVTPPPIYVNPPRYHRPPFYDRPPYNRPPHNRPGNNNPPPANKPPPVNHPPPVNPPPGNNPPPGQPGHVTFCDLHPELPNCAIAPPSMR